MAHSKIGNRYSAPFKPNKGVRQGCVLSPLLFNIFLADLQKELDSCNDNVKLGENKEFFFFFMHLFSGTKHPREDNPNLYYWAEMTGLHTHKHLTYNRYQSH